eukprot:gene36317-biopygen2063
MFVRYLSHEIRTPLSAVVLGLNYLKRQSESYKTTMDQDTIDVVEEVRMSCEAAVDILNDVLTYEKLDGGLMQTYFKHEPAFEFIRNATKPFKLQARSLGIDLSIKVGVDEGICDRAYNNRNNDFEAISENSNDVGNKSRSINVNDNNNALSGANPNIDQNALDDFSVNIDKLKISQENQRRLFKEVIQFSPDVLQNGNGSGFGLWNLKSESDEQMSSKHQNIHISNRIFPSSDEDMIDVWPITSVTGNGVSGSVQSPSQRSLKVQYLSLESVPDRSDSKSIRSSPLRSSKSNTRRTKCKSVEVDNEFIAEVPLSGPLSVLLVDDAGSNRKMVRRILDKNLFIPDEAEDGFMAVAKVTKMIERGEAPYDVILMDFMMPKMDGPTATRAIRGLGYTGIIIGVTGNSSPKDLETFTSSGADLVMPKPLDIDLLVANIRRK